MVDKDNKMNKIMKKFSETNLLKRSLSALLIFPIFLFALYEGGFFYNIIILILGIIIVYEWFSIVIKAKNDVIKKNKKYKWYFFGILYSLLFMYSMAFLRNQPDINNAFNYKLILWICLIVWTTDVAAYFTGIVIGGPKIAPKISPSKTWSGFFGAILFSLVIHEIATRTVVENLFNPKIHIFITWFAVTLTSIISQIGDFLESAFKRCFNVKDSGIIIPGHGGVMDRIDGLAMASISWVLLLILWNLCTS